MHLAGGLPEKFAVNATQFGQLIARFLHGVAATLGNRLDALRERVADLLVS